MSTARLTLCALTTLLLGLPGCRKPEPYVKVDSEVDYQSDEDDEAGQLDPVAYAQPRFGGRRVDNALCEMTKNPAVDSEMAAAWHSTRMVEDPKVLEQSVGHSRKALGTEPRAARGYLLLGSALAKLKENREALKSYETFVLSCPRDLDAHRVVFLFQKYEDRRKAQHL